MDVPSEFADVLEVRGVEVGGHRVLRAQSSTVPNAIAAFLLHLRDTTNKEPHCYFGWAQGNPIVYLFSYLLFGEGDTAPGHPRDLERGRAGSRAAAHHPCRRSIGHFGGTIRAMQESSSRAKDGEHTYLK